MQREAPRSKNPSRTKSYGKGSHDEGNEVVRQRRKFLYKKFTTSYNEVATREGRDAELSASGWGGEEQCSVLM